jgi:hypothetical protein
MKPKYKHDCIDCKFLGTKKYQDKEYDLYYCNPTKDISSGTLIARFSDEGSEYSSGTGFATIKPIIALAAVRAMVLGYLDIEELRLHCNAHQFEY